MTYSASWVHPSEGMSLDAFMKNNPGYIGRNMRTNLIIGGLFFVLAISIAAFFLAPTGRALLDRFSLLPRTERTTALYFSDSKLLTSFAAGQQFAPRFVIKNHEHQAVDYTYDIAQDDRILMSSEVKVEDGMHREIAPEIVFSQADTNKTKLTITIRYTTGSSEKNNDPQTRSIFIWLTNKEESAYDDPNQSG